MNADDRSNIQVQRAWSKVDREAIRKMNESWAAALAELEGASDEEE